MKTYTDFVFDIDGTLLDTERTGVLSLVQTIRELTGREVSYEEAYGFFGTPSAKASETLGYDDPDRFAEVWETHFQELMYLVKPFPGVVELLDALKENGVRLGIVTSRSRFELQYDPVLAPLLPRFDAVISSGDSVRHKPFPTRCWPISRAPAPRPPTRSTLAIRCTTGSAVTQRAAISHWRTGKEGEIRESRRTTASVTKPGCGRSSACRGGFSPCRSSISCTGPTVRA